MTGETPSAGTTISTPTTLVVVYFSRANENYGVGVVEQGNTAILAEMIAAKTASDTFEIKPATAYPEGYQECCDVALEPAVNRRKVAWIVPCKARRLQKSTC